MYLQNKEFNFSASIIAINEAVNAVANNNIKCIFVKLFIKFDITTTAPFLALSMLNNAIKLSIIDVVFIELFIMGYSFGSFVFDIVEAIIVVWELVSPGRKLVSIEDIKLIIVFFASLILSIIILSISICFGIVVFDFKLIMSELTPNNPDNNGNSGCSSVFILNTASPNIPVRANNMNASVLDFDFHIMYALIQINTVAM